jgi:hypothetical protein
MLDRCASVITYVVSVPVYFSWSWFPLKPLHIHLRLERALDIDTAPRGYAAQGSPDPASQKCRSVLGREGGGANRTYMLGSPRGSAVLVVVHLLLQACIARAWSTAGLSLPGRTADMLQFKKRVLNDGGAAPAQALVRRLVDHAQPRGSVCAVCWHLIGP